MRAPLDLLPFALLALATIVGVAIVLVLSDLLRRFVLFLIATLLPSEPTTPPRPSRAREPVRAGPDGDRPALPR